MIKDIFSIIVAATLAMGLNVTQADEPAVRDAEYAPPFTVVEETSVIADYRMPEEAASVRGKQKGYTVTLSGYSSTPEETDSTPFITASGNFVRHGIVAANFLKIGTRIRIPQVFGNKVFIVEDRMAPRYQNNVDIWFGSKAEALEFGRKQAKIEIL